ncbi:MAG: hypothetical protein AB1698_03565 [Pseudomonadota bacterium]
MAKKFAIPKKIAGFRVPKAIRKSPLVSTLLASETGRKVLGEALVAGAAAAAAILVKNNGRDMAHAADQAITTTKNAGSVAVDAIHGAGSAMLEVLGEAARSALPEKTAKKYLAATENSESKATH